MKSDRRSAARNLAGMGRGGDTMLAHITPQEARMLHRTTDGGSINPRTGLLEFDNGDDNDSGGQSESGDSTDGMSVSSDPGPDPGQQAEYGGFDTVGDTAGRGISGPVGMGMADPGSLHDQMFNAGMNIDNPFDNFVARTGAFFGLPPDPSKMSQLSMFGFGGGLPGLVAAHASKTIPGLFGLVPQANQDYGNLQSNGDGLMKNKMLAAVLSQR